MDAELYNIFSHKPNYTVGNKPRLNLYYEPKFPKIPIKAGGLINNIKKDEDTKYIHGKLRVKDDPKVKRTKNGMVDISFSMVGDEGPIVLFLHGVPANKTSYYPIMNKLRSFARCVCIDMLGMGESQVNRNEVVRLNKRNEKDINWQFRVWLWKYDSDYIYNFMKHFYGSEKFIFVSDDWGAGVATFYATKYPNTLLNQIYIDPIALDGYPVNEIQAIGRPANLPDKEYQMAMGAFDQTAIQIYKTMVHKPDQVWNQWTYRWIQKTYVNVDYIKGFSSNMSLKWNNLRNLSDRSYVLGGPQLLPFHPTKNKIGVNYSKMTANCLILWGELDNMMPESQRHRLRYIINLATKNKVKVETRQIPNSGHFAGIESPDHVADSILDYLMSQHGVEKFKDVFLGFNNTLLWKGDEKQIMEDIRTLFLI